MTKLAIQPLRTPLGPMHWQDFGPWFSQAIRDQLRQMDIRDGNQQPLYGRTVTLPTLATYIGNAGRAASQRFLYPISAANRSSVQSTSTVLTATTGATTSTIAIGSHSVKFDFGSVSYNSGSVSGLTPETLYYVYADDADFAGGAVTYYATTNPDNLIAQGRYYVGYILTPVTASAGNISAATSANPIEFTTSAAHGWSTGDTVEFASLPGDFGTNLNGNQYVITRVDATKFTIAVNGSGYAAYTTGGTATRQTSSVQTGGGAGAGVGGSRWDYAVP